MGVDEGHMSYERLAQSIPPAYGQLVFTQMCMWRAHRRWADAEFRADHCEQLDDAIEAWTSKRTKYEVFAKKKGPINMSVRYISRHLRKQFINPAI